MSQGGASGETRRGFSAHAGATPGRAALVLGDRTLTYGQLDSRSGWVARALRGMGVDAGDRVAVMLPNGFELFECALALAKLDAALVPVNWHLKADELTWILTDSAAAVLVTDAAIWDSVSAAGARVPGCRVVVFGHTHIPVCEDRNGLLLLNPGSPTERRRGPVHSFAELEVADGAVAAARIIPLDAG